MDVGIRPATREDQSLVLPLLKELNSTVDWTPLFARYWETEEDWIGYLAEVDGRAVGFLGVIFSRRVIDGKELKFCNTTSWIVEEEYRMFSLALLGQVMKLHEYQIVNLSASEAVHQISIKLGFKKLDSALCIVPAIPTANGLLKGFGVKCIRRIERIRELLNDDDRKKLDDHAATSCEHFLLSNGARYCYVLGTRVTRHGLPFFRVHYLSDADFFTSAIGWLRVKLCFLANVVALVFDKRFLRGNRIQLSVQRELPWQRLYKGNAIRPSELDNLYSEYTVLRI